MKCSLRGVITILLLGVLIGMVLMNSIINHAYCKNRQRERHVMKPRTQKCIFHFYFLNINISLTIID